MQNRTRAALAASAATALLVTSPPASALELTEGSGRARPGLTTVDVSETRWAVRVFLRDYLGSAVADAHESPRVAVTRCWAQDNVGACRGWVSVGSVTCSGVFGVRKVPGDLWVFPKRASCGASAR